MENNLPTDTSSMIDVIQKANDLFAASENFVGIKTAFLAGSASSLFILLLVFLIWPEKVEKCLAMALSLFRWTHKGYTKYRIQGSVNHFIKRHTKEMPGLSAKGVKIQWSENTKRDAFLNGNMVVLRLRRNEERGQNLAHATFLFISTSLLYKAKRYLSPSQCEATDLYTTMKLLEEEEKEEVVAAFLDHYLHPTFKKKGEKAKKLRKYFTSFEKIDKGGYFFTIYLREVYFLGQKVFGTKHQHALVPEVEELIEYLKKLSEREVGSQSVPNAFVKTRCRFSVMIVGRKKQVSLSLDPYEDYIRNNIIPPKIESLYLVGPIQNKKAMEEVAKRVGDTFTVVRKHHYRPHLRFNASPGSTQVDSYVVVLRNRTIDNYIPEPDDFEPEIFDPLEE